MSIGPVSHAYIRPTAGDFTLQLSRLTDAVAQSDRAAGTDDERRVLLTRALTEILASPCDHEFITLTRAELCFAIYRRLRLLDPGPQEAQIQDILNVGMAAIHAARRLAAQKHPWWNIVNAIFQNLCVLLSVNSTESLGNLGPTMETLETIHQTFRSPLTQEALNTARLLIRASMDKKSKEVTSLRAILGETDQHFAPPSEIQCNIRLQRWTWKPFSSQCTILLNFLTFQTSNEDGLFCKTRNLQLTSSHDD